MKPSSSKTLPLAPAPSPLVIVLSGPSGTGKDAVLAAMKTRALSLAFIVTNTTRPQRPGEVDNVDYHFVSRQEFTRLKDCQELLEHAEVYGYFYGVPIDPVRQALARGKDVLVKVDVQGAMTIKKQLPGAVLIFLMPPSLKELAQRLKGRGTESASDLEIRLDTARAEIEQKSSFDYVVMSRQDRIEQAVSDIEAIIRAEKLRVAQRAYVL
jgi:guanylate kinase